MRARIIVLAGLLAVWLLGRSDVSGQGPQLTRGPYLQSTTRDSVSVVWQTDIAGDSVIEYGETGYTEVLSDTAPITTHVMRVSGLAAGTTYRYRVSSGSAVLHEATLATAPDTGGAFEFVVIGDSGTGSQAQRAVAAQMLALDPDFILHTGDVIYPKGEAQWYGPYFFTPYRDLLDHSPVFPSLGNHDYGTADAQPYLDAFYLPEASSGGERYYSFDWGNAHFVALDTNQPYASGSAQYDWLVSDLSASTATWKFVFFHHAFYSSGPHGLFDGYVRPMREALAPVFAQHSVDIVFSGHDHDYERSKPIDGVIYIVSGGGGATLYPVGASDFTAYSASVHHTVQVRFRSCILSLRAVDANGTVFDQIGLAKNCPHHVYLPIIVKE